MHLEEFKQEKYSKIFYLFRIEKEYFHNCEG